MPIAYPFKLLMPELFYLLWSLKEFISAASRALNEIRVFKIDV
jgi:hypothetical protein